MGWVATSIGALLLTLVPPSAAISDPPSYPNCTDKPSRQSQFSVTVVDRDLVPDGASLISHLNGSSDFSFNFATAWFPTIPGSATPDGLVVRVVECSPNHHSCANTTHQEWTNAGALAVVPANVSGSGSKPTTAHVTDSLVTWGGAQGPPPANESKWGAADPRMTYRPADKTYYMT
jgi:hypothetical protein